MKFEDLFGDMAKNLTGDNESESEQKSESINLPVKSETKPNPQKKPAVAITFKTVVGVDSNGNPKKSWVSRERQNISKDIIDNLKGKVDIFNTNGYLSCYDESTDNWYLFDDKSKTGVLVDTHILCMRLSEKNGIQIAEPVDCPNNVSEYLVHSRELISKLDKVIGVARHPYFDNNFNVVNNPGYNKETQYYLPKSCVIDKDVYRDMTMQEAYDVFEEYLGCMNYKTEVDKQADLACFLTPPWKMLIGNSPIVSVTSNSPGSGKGLRQRIFNSVWTNNKGAIISKPKNEDALRQQLFAALRSGFGHISVDNISDKLLSDVVATYATEPSISDRAVYGKTLESYDNILFISVNGNNLRFSEDLATRLLPIHLDITESSLVRDYKAEGRKTQPEIESYAKNNRDKIIGASLKISQDYIDKGMPDKDTGGSRFESWRRCVLNSVYYALEVLGKDYLLNGFVIDAKRAADPESQSRGNLFKAILDVIGVDKDDPNKSNPFTTTNCEVSGIFDLASHFDRIGTKPAIGHDILSEYIDGTTERSRMTQLAIYFRDKSLDKIHYGWRLVKEPNQLKVKRALKPTYRLVMVAKGDSKFYVPGTDGYERPILENKIDTHDINDPDADVSL